jgi:hypothetical protein
MKTTVFISFPRSGRTYLRRLLREYYGGAGAGDSPLNEPHGISFDHDLNLDRAIDPDAQYVVLTRDPVRAVHSWEKMDDNRFPTYAAKANLWIEFSRKWVFPKATARRLVIPYEDLVSDTQRILHILIWFMEDGIPDPVAIDRVIRDNPPRFSPWNT